METFSEYGLSRQHGEYAAGPRRRTCWCWLYELRSPLTDELMLCAATGTVQSRLLGALVKPGQENDLRTLIHWLALGGDFEAVCVAHIAAMTSIFEAGRDFNEFKDWLDSAASILVPTIDVSPQGRGALLLQCVVAELVGRGDLTQAADRLEQLATLAEEADCDALRIGHAAASVYREVMAGRLPVANGIVSDALHLNPRPGAHGIPKLHLQVSHGLLNIRTGSFSIVKI